MKGEVEENKRRREMFGRKLYISFYSKEDYFIMMFTRLFFSAEIFKFFSNYLASQRNLIANTKHFCDVSRGRILIRLKSYKVV